MAFFKMITSKTLNPEKKNAVVMGRKTWDSIPSNFRPLRNRINIILSREMKEPPEGTYLARSFEDILTLVSSDPLEKEIENVHIIGGSSLYKMALESSCDCRLYVTKVLADVTCDTFFPDFEKNFIKIQNPEDVPTEEFTENGMTFLFEVYERQHITNGS